MTFSQIEEYFLKLGARPRSLIELANTQAAKELVKAGVGVTIAAPWGAREDLAHGTLATVPLVRGKIARQWIAARLKAKPESLAQRIFIGLCEDAGRVVLGA
jgi:DNA-binding transcriptional LysR family regulator